MCVHFGPKMGRFSRQRPAFRTWVAHKVSYPVPRIFIFCPTYTRVCFFLKVNVIWSCFDAGARRLERHICFAVDAEAQEQISKTTEDSVGLSIEVLKSPDVYSVIIQGDASRTDLRIHWAINEWNLVPEECRPQGTVQVDDLAVQTALDENGRITIEFPVDSCPSKIVFVVKEGEKWIHNGAGDFAVYLKPPGVDDVIAKVIAAETEYERWSLFDRVNLATGLLDAAIAAGPNGMGFILAWLRLSSMRLLPWYKGSNYQSKDAAHAQKVLAQKMADLSCSAKDPSCRLFSRISLSTLPRGGGNGDDIRMGILHIMRENGIREGHRPGIECNFLESWHQKLHTNTTPEDITICEAYLAFLNSGDMNEFWRVAWENGRITPESLSQMDHPVMASPIHLPQLIGPMEHYLWILKTTHAGADLDVAFEMVRGHLDGELSWMIGDMLSNRNEWWVPGKIVEIRQKLSGYWKGTAGCGRDILLLDIALDSYFRILIERMDKSNLSADDVINIVTMVLTNSIISSESETLECSAEFWRKVFDGEPRWSGPDWAKRALSASDTVLVSLEEFADNIAANVQPHAFLFGSKCNIDENYILNFSEEVVRGQSVATLGPLLQQVTSSLRASAELGPWEIVSAGLPGPLIGKIKYLENLESIQGVRITDPTVYVVDKLTGNEDIPENVLCIITSQSTDVLSHIAIRARAQSVLLATCYDASIIERAKNLASDDVTVQVNLDAGGCIAVAPCNPELAGSGKKGTPTEKQISSRMNASIVPSKAWVLDQDEFEEGQVGGKSLNIQKLLAILSDTDGDIHVPKSVALPYGTLSKVMDDKSNAKAKKAITDLKAKLASRAQAHDGVPVEVQQLKGALATTLTPPSPLLEQLNDILSKKDMMPLSTEVLWDAICHVWASVFNDRAWLSRRSMGIPDEDLFMSVLLQELVPANYAFVLHTSDPITGSPDTVHGEIVLGMGEALVSNMPGRALSFVCHGDGSTSISSYPSKIRALYCDTSSKILMARSDSNGEDLEEFAGAGLYSSVPVPMTSYQSTAISYAHEPLVWDDSFRQNILKTLSDVGKSIEQACSSPQDIEGVIRVDHEGALSVYIVQTRPQVL